MQFSRREGKNDLEALGGIWRRTIRRAGEDQRIRGGWRAGTDAAGAPIFAAAPVQPGQPQPSPLVSWKPWR